MLKGWYFGITEKAIGNEINQDIPIENATDGNIQGIDQGANERSHREFVLNNALESHRLLLESEKSIKVGFACLIIRYFNALAVVQKEKEGLSTDNDRTAEKRKIHTEERSRMIEEEKNILYRERVTKEMNEKAKRGAERINVRRDMLRTKKVIYITFLFLLM